MYASILQAVQYGRSHVLDQLLEMSMFIISVHFLAAAAAVVAVAIQFRSFQHCCSTPCRTSGTHNYVRMILQTVENLLRASVTHRKTCTLLWCMLLGALT